MLEKTLAVQYAGDKAASDKYIDDYTQWDENLHAVIAANIRAQQQYRFRLFKYAALGE
jgi:sulfur relay (sulfurtransferase) DsrC/TusE family protein